MHFITKNLCANTGEFKVHEHYLAKYKLFVSLRFGNWEEMNYMREVPFPLFVVYFNKFLLIYTI